MTRRGLAISLQAVSLLVIVGLALYSYRVRGELKIKDLMWEAVWHSGSAVVVVDSDGNIEDWSSGAEMMTGYKREQMVGRSLTLIMGEEYVTRHVAAFKAAVAEGAIKTSTLDECHIVTSIGRRMPVTIVIRSLPKSRFVGIIDRKQTTPNQ